MDFFFRSNYLMKGLGSALNLQKLKALSTLGESPGATGLWDAEMAPLCIEDESGAELSATPKCSGVFRYLDFTCAAL